MLLPRSSRLGSLFCLFLFAGVAVGAAIEPARRDGVTSTAVAQTTSSTQPTATTTSGKDVSVTSSVSVASVSSSVSSASSISSKTTSSALATASSSLNSTLFNTTTIASGELPLEPKVTPGWAVASVILMITGALYALIGIKNKWIHTFLSTAYLSSLGTTVLLVYIMALPVSNAIHGAYVVAVVCTGLLVGGIALVFKDVTECLGCLLGGFCLSMWLLTVQEGGLVQSSSGRIGFIAAFSAVVFFLYFSHFTRTYALIGSISFSGATAVVIGIDCVSRAGLKEFWVYLWALNENVFPFGTTTYPLTKGMRVELALTVMIFLAGIVSQMRLWRLIQERRAKRDAERAEDERELQAKEEAIGRRIEEANRRERRAWERRYGDETGGLGDEPKSPMGGSQDSGVGDMESEKRGRDSGFSGAAATQSSRGTPSPVDGERQVEISELPAENLAQMVLPPPPPPKPKTAAETVLSRDASDGMVTVMVATDDVPEVAVDEAGVETTAGKVWVMCEDGKMRLAEPIGDPRRISKMSVVVPPPNVVPLPFTVPEASLEDDRSSVATYADEDEREEEEVNDEGNDEQPVPEQERELPQQENETEPMTKRLSSDSAKPLKSPAQIQGEKSEMAGGVDESREALVEADTEELKDDNDSLAANLDDLSSDGDEATTRDDDEDLRNIEISTEVGNQQENEQTTGLASTATDQASKPGVTVAEKETISNRDETGSSQEAKSTGRSRGPKSTVSMDSTPASLTKGNLPQAFSRVALSYRTNEWAKHLSVADNPEPDNLQLNECPEETQASPGKEAPSKEEPAPLNIMELQQTAETGTPAPALPRSASVASNYSNGPARMSARAGAYQQLTGMPQPPMEVAMQMPKPKPATTGPPLTHQNKTRLGRPKSGTLNRQTSVVMAEPIAEEVDSMNSSRSTPIPDNTAPIPSLPTSMSPSPAPPEPLNPSMRPPVPGVMSFTSPQSLMGKRDMLLRSRSSGNFQALATNNSMPILSEPAYGGQSGGFVHPNLMNTLKSMQSMPQMHATPTTHAPYPSNDMGSLSNYPLYAAAFNTTPSPISGPVVNNNLLDDDMPMSHRREAMRKSSAGPHFRPASGLNFLASSSEPHLIPGASANLTAFDSHQPARHSTVASEATRQAQLAQFRNSVAADLRAGASTQAAGAPGDARTSIDLSRHVLLGQKEAEAARREAETMERERSQREFEERMRSGMLLGAHRDAMRRMQGAVRK